MSCLVRKCVVWPAVGVQCPCVAHHQHLLSLCQDLAALKEQLDLHAPDGRVDYDQFCIIRDALSDQLVPFFKASLFVKVCCGVPWHVRPGPDPHPSVPPSRSCPLMHGTQLMRPYSGDMSNKKWCFRKLAFNSRTCRATACVRSVPSHYSPLTWCQLARRRWHRLLEGDRS